MLASMQSSAALCSVREMGTRLRKVLFCSALHTHVKLVSSYLSISYHLLGLTEFVSSPMLSEYTESQKNHLQTPSHSRLPSRVFILQIESAASLFPKCYVEWHKQ